MLRVFHSSQWAKMIGVIRFYVVKGLYRKRFISDGVCLVGRNCDFIITRQGKIEFGRRDIIGNQVQIYSSGLIQFGDNVSISEYSRIIAHDKISIGKNVTIAKFVTILDHDHAYRMRDEQLILNGYNVQPVLIGNNVLIGDKATILKGVKIGDNVIIGAHTLVNKDVPSNSLVAGVPVRVIKKL